MTEIAKDHFDRTNDEAKAVFEALDGKDPLEYISPALLNSADIYAYAAKTAMIWPYCQKNLKSASYEADLIGTIIYWDENGDKKTKRIEKGGEHILFKHSISFIAPDLQFRLPDYLAVRFNLQIKLVHSGILLGTGPLVDPGFEGQLLIPLHNLTNNDYVIKGGEGLIWVEFTKLSENPRWQSSSEKSEFSDYYVPFPPTKKNKKPEEFLGKALAGQSFNFIHSSIPTAILKASAVEERVKVVATENENKINGIDAKLNAAVKDQAKSATDFERDIRDHLNKQKKFDIFAGLAVFIAIITVTVAMWQLHIGTRSLVQDSVNYVKNNQKYFDNISSMISRQNNKIVELERKIAQKNK